MYCFPLYIAIYCIVLFKLSPLFLYVHLKVGTKLSGNQSVLQLRTHSVRHKTVVLAALPANFYLQQLCLSVCLYNCLQVSLFISLYFLSFCLYVCGSICLSVGLSVCPSHLFLSVCLVSIWDDLPSLDLLYLSRVSHTSVN